MKVCTKCESKIPNQYKVCPKPICKCTEFREDKRLIVHKKDVDLGLLETAALLMVEPGDCNFEV